MSIHLFSLQSGNKFVNGVIHKLQSVYRKTTLTRKAEYAAEKIKRENGPCYEFLSEALLKTVKEIQSLEEKKYIEKIEALREKMYASAHKLRIEDLGAGSKKGGGNEKEVKEIVVSASAPPFWGVFLFNLIRSFKPAVCLELGSSLGISTAYLASGLKLNGAGGFCVTIEGSPEIAQRADENFNALNLDNIKLLAGKFREALPAILKEKLVPEFVFIDGHHDEKATLDYFNYLYPHLADKSVIIFDDISWSAGMQKAWEKICSSAGVNLALDLHKMGLCCINKSSDKKTIVKL